MEKILKLKVLKRTGKFMLDVYFEFREGFNVILGSSGAGKTTLLRIISGLEKPDVGFMEYKGKVFFDTEKNIFLSPQKRKLSFIFQEDNLLPHLSVNGNIKFALNNSPNNGGIDRLLDIFKLKGLENKYPHELSGGERQRVAILRALICQPEAILMDEPFSSLDFNTKFEIMTFLKETVTINIPLIIVTHDPLEALYLADRVFIMEKGRKIEEGEKDIIRRYFEKFFRLI